MSPLPASLTRSSRRADGHPVPTASCLAVTLATRTCSAARQPQGMPSPSGPAARHRRSGSQRETWRGAGMAGRGGGQPLTPAFC